MLAISCGAKVRHTMAAAPMFSTQFFHCPPSPPPNPIHREQCRMALRVESAGRDDKSQRCRRWQSARLHAANLSTKMHHGHASTQATGSVTANEHSAHGVAVCPVLAHSVEQLARLWIAGVQTRSDKHFCLFSRRAFGERPHAHEEGVRGDVGGM